MCFSHGDSGFRFTERFTAGASGSLLHQPTATHGPQILIPSNPSGASLLKGWTGRVLLTLLLNCLFLFFGIKLKLLKQFPSLNIQNIYQKIFQSDISIDLNSLHTPYTSVGHG